ncbi:MAG: hypothetical protein ACI9P7_002447, partial [Candidatus Azotimanducaceae bacterium]
SDGPNSWPLGRMKELLTLLKEFDGIVKSNTMPEDNYSQQQSSSQDNSPQDIAS